MKRRTQRWDSSHAPDRPARRADDFVPLGRWGPLWFYEDDRSSRLPIRATTVVLDLYDADDYDDLVLPVIRQHRLAKINHYWTPHGLAVTFRTAEDAVKFKLFYRGQNGD